MAPPTHKSTCPNLRMQPCCIDIPMASSVESSSLLLPGRAAIVQPIAPTVIGSFQEFQSLFLHQFASSRKHRKIELSLFSIRQKEGESLKDYLERLNTAALEVPSATQEVKASAFAQGLVDEDFFKSLAKKSATKFDILLAQAAKYINMDNAQASKREGRGEKRKENKDEGSFKKSKMDFKDKKPAWQRVNAVYTPITIPLTQALITVEGKGLLSRPMSYKDGPQHPKSNKFFRFHNDYGHTTKECRHLKSKIERLIQNGYLQEYGYWEKARDTRPYQKYEMAHVRIAAQTKTTAQTRRMTKA
ncbi:UNVERIFIED_CONTAM: hypothetical protein Sradi_5760500 [Sesamum radiatum]|uniref:Retrotransposon gag domain-containing protein n=1 Tax=Sesamum radiatum TaxID=300843 RepID=A0AAW2L5A6_SESRA